MWSRDALLFAILLALIHLSSRLPAEGDAPLLAAAGVLGAIVFAGRTLYSVAELFRPTESASDGESA